MSPTCGHYLGTVSSMDLMGHLPRRLNVYGLCELKVSSDGNCQFRALSDQLYRSSEYHKQVRGEVVKQLKDNRTIYESYVLMKYKRYYKRMAKLGEWETILPYKLRQIGLQQRYAC
ncbi:OVARIAN TUMOR DOMAIN-containing deubiquitinating enzyme 12 [Brassica rapa]|uniref:OVARIAN TUMOR DOMAIN-containing deubiquitinating enzyme 12 n=1 Tax=Brassica campestris TaxID=3711 RepID=UPI00142E513E|nr:OVARIAN TUMOR DOMAIN-containing deubiquitinating enzyme 12 [Brassica rapa]